MKIDDETRPKCKLEEKKFSWGEPYLDISPIFDIQIPKKLTDLEFCIEIFIRNNFKNQLLEFYNVLTNYEENERIEHFEGLLSNKFRKGILLKIKKELDSEMKLTPWEKYKQYNEELDFLYIFEKEFKRKILFIKPNK